MPNPEKRERFSSFSRLAGTRGRGYGWLLVLFLLFMDVSLSRSLPAAGARQPLVINMNEAGCLRLQVEIAADSEARQTGLMHRDHLPENAGMLFDYQREQSVQMWMKDTLISLDMLFIDGNGRIVHIVENTEPGSEKLIESGRPVRAVLELNGGSVKRYGIQVGDQVRHSIFGMTGD